MSRGPGVPWLSPGAPFPPTDQALTEPDGLLALGADLSVETLVRAYSSGIFPWFNDDQPILWWTPDPRLVLLPEHFHLSRSLRRLLRRDHFQFSIDQHFPAVMDACAAPRDADGGTWIVAEMRDAYLALHRAGYAHSVEVWQDGTLCGGLYGVCLGGVFFGESMFSRADNASKAALALLCRLQPAHGIELIDCQMETPHLLSLGARTLPRRDFEAKLSEGIRAATPSGWHWPHLAAPLTAYVARYSLVTP
ncbi:leucyl/phenylalanyl-tRNA--protein transferase [Alcanivorax sp. JB21]|uniref:leucyl/phenylalanyl-tRNA--protein transferase n=1 Tax=Alcanivorax limicola TaxID=2874102 RepID=UPI001CC11840|nr:leucyl/phenylalanyl-tRNA--protein transferase [Alcanivorax limicola]MBZ2187821.1 leucyl/phenylalanyl-tRNA--protein transferase [Alcanivorax limicola]